MTFGSGICHEHHDWFSGSENAEHKLNSHETYSVVKNADSVTQQF